VAVVIYFLLFFKEKKEIQSVWRDPKRTIYNSATDAQASKKSSNYSCRCLSGQLWQIKFYFNLSTEDKL
jgi:hypothetical protein